MGYLKLNIFQTLLLALAMGMGLCEGGVNDLIFDGNKTLNLRHLQKVTDAEGLKIFWWNVAWGGFNLDGHVNHNLVNLVESSSRPDLLILGEFKDSAISSHAWTVLRRHYAYSDFVPYSPGDEVGVITFSLTPFTREVQRGLDWTPLDRNMVEREAYKKSWLDKNYNEVRHWDRAYVLYSSTVMGKKYYFSPVHLLEPWEAINQSEGKITLIYNMFFGGDNPLDYQIARYRSFLNYDLGAGGIQNGQPLIAIGDFNAPKEIFLMTPDSYNSLSRGLTEGFWGNQNTFPSRYAEGKSGRSLLPMSVKIDHVFFNKKFEKVGGTALEFTGSDHYPIYVVVKPATSSSWWPF
ncbi:MAG: hypothetical protein A2X86_19140 [Bdellovibrionales bacterium GWA2_49_15]|nr:MAG: hypothetical protein A2X86_19140 [Bdellovibrionales bacterium GWA2_49_15]HAZ14343.1 hypothetical protein [Bdellovibrionales bacterium]